jgi:hypothetical protein
MPFILRQRRFTRPKVKRTWRKYLLDVCSFEKRINVKRAVFITHLHLDHLPLQDVIRFTGSTIKCATPLIPYLRRRYRNCEIEEYRDYVKTYHTNYYVGRKPAQTETFCYFFENVALIPESDEASELIKEYESKYAFIFLSKQPRNHLSSWKKIPFDPERTFILDNSVWRAYAPNIVPKVVPAASDEEQIKVKILNVGNRRTIILQWKNC